MDAHLFSLCVTGVRMNAAMTGELQEVRKYGSSMFDALPLIIRISD